MRFYAACLASYNNGVLHGRWIEASSDVYEMQEEVDAMLRESKFPNVSVECAECDGRGHLYEEDAEGCIPDCPTCKGDGKVSSAEEWAVHDYEDMPSTLGEFCRLQAIADYVELVEAAEDAVAGEDNARMVAQAALENWHDVDSAKDALDNFCGVYDTFRDYADEEADQRMDDHAIPRDNLIRAYFDYEMWARDLAHSMTVLELPNGDVAIFHD